MKNLIISLICLMILLIPWGIYDRFSARTVDDYRIRIEEKILPAIEADDWNAAYEEFDYIAKDWDRFRSVSAFFIDTGAVNETDRVISKVYYYIKFRDPSKSAGELAYLRYSLSFLHENELPTPGNIF